MKWQELFELNLDGELVLIADELKPQSRKEALSLSILKWEAMVELGPTNGSGWTTCGMCALYTCQSSACYSGCGVNCINIGSPHHIWQENPTINNTRAVLDQLKTMYLEEFGNVVSTD